MQQRFYTEKRFIFILITSIIALALYFFWDSSFLIRSIATVSFLFIFYAGDKVYNIKFKGIHYVLFTVLVVAGVLASPIYFIWPQYDKVQHFSMPILMSIITYHMVNKLPLERKWKIAYTFFIVVAILGIFEIIEYSLDQFFDFKLQGVFIRSLSDLSGSTKLEVVQEPLDDTMFDLLFGALGTSIYSILKSAKKD